MGKIQKRFQTMKIRVIVPTTADDHIVAEQEKFQEIARSDTEISTVGLECAPDNVENDFDIALSLVGPENRCQLIFLKVFGESVNMDA